MSASKIFRGLIMGAPGSGKGTISQRIVKKFQIKYLACGDILRQNIKDETALGRVAIDYIAKGQLVPDDLVIKCIVEQIDQLSNYQEPWLLDGFPRTVPQAERLAEHKVDLISCINLNVPHALIIDRIQGRWIHEESGRVYNTTYNKPKVPYRDDVTGDRLIQREDDKPETVQKRLEVYEANTKPVIDYYRKHNILVDFNGGSSDIIWSKVEPYLAQFF